jgi:neprilysin
MNFGAIGSIIGHEITHAFDDQASKSETWSEESRTAYQKRVDCIINQYSQYRVEDIEEYFDDVEEFHLNGNLTQKEDIADCGGVKLALRAFKKFEKREPELNKLPIGLQNFNNEKLFWLSFAQFFCRFDDSLTLI